MFEVKENSNTERLSKWALCNPNNLGGDSCVFSCSNPNCFMSLPITISLLKEAYETSCLCVNYKQDAISSRKPSNHLKRNVVVISPGIDSTIWIERKHLIAPVSQFQARRLS